MALKSLVNHYCYDKNTSQKVGRVNKALRVSYQPAHELMTLPQSKLEEKNKIDTGCSYLQCK